MIRVELRIDVSAVAETVAPIHTAVSVALPDSGARAGTPICFAFPGAGYGRAYFDMQVPGHRGYSMAEAFAADGVALVAVDHLGAGDSTLPQGGVTPDLIVAANHATVGAVVRAFSQDPRLRGAVAADAPLIGIGHSMGGHLVTRQQANHRTFAAIAVLGWSADHTAIRHADGSLFVPISEAGVAAYTGHVAPPASVVAPNEPPRPDGYLYLRPRPPIARWAFYPDGLNPAVVEADEAAMSVIAPGVKETFSEPGFGRASALAIDVPLLLAFGLARDVSADPRAEPAFYPAADDITLVLVPGSAHCHNFAPNRSRLWDRLLRWTEVVTQTDPGGSVAPREHCAISSVSG